MSANTGRGSRGATVATIVVAVLAVVAFGVGGVVAGVDVGAANGTADASLSAGEIAISSSGFDDDDVVVRRGETAYLWADESATFTLTLETGQGDGEGHYDACLRSTASGGSSRAVDCTALVLSSGSTTEVTFTVDSWGEVGPGARTLTAVVTADTLDAEVAAEVAHDVVVLRKTADPDADGATTRREVRAGTDFFDNDTDDDGLLDGLELDTYGTDPVVADTDGDGLDDGREIEETRTDPTATDTDGDGLSDRREVAMTDTSPTRADTDGDGLQDGREVRVLGTDPTNVDTDGDGLVDGREVTTHDTNPTVADTDGDGLSDAHELHGVSTDPTVADTDGDGISDGREVNEIRSDPLDVDTDGDGLRDGRELSETGTDPLVVDTDGDGLRDGREVTVFGTDPLSADTDGDGIADAREVDASPVPRWVQVNAAALTAGAVLLVGTLFAFVTRRRWLPRVPASVRRAVRESRAVGRLRAAYPRARVDAVTDAVRDANHRVRSAATAARAAAVRPEQATEADGGQTVTITDETPSSVSNAAAAGSIGAQSSDRSDDASTPSTGAGANQGESDATPSAGVQPAPDPVLTPADEVRALLAENGGRLKQSEIVDRTDWSKSKVSRTLSRMAADGDVEKTTIGRGNVISLPGHTPEGARSPFDDE